MVLSISPFLEHVEPPRRTEPGPLRSSYLDSPAITFSSGSMIELKTSRWGFNMLEIYAGERFEIVYKTTPASFSVGDPLSRALC